MNIERERERERERGRAHSPSNCALRAAAGNERGGRSALDIVSTAFTFLRFFFLLPGRYLGLFTFAISVFLFPSPFSFPFVPPTLSSSVLPSAAYKVDRHFIASVIFSFITSRTQEAERQLRSLWAQLRRIRTACERPNTIDKPDVKCSSE